MNFVHTSLVNQSIAVPSPERHRKEASWFCVTATFRDSQKLADEINAEQEHVTQLELPLEEVKEPPKAKRKGTTRKGCRPFWVDPFVEWALTTMPKLAADPKGLARVINKAWNMEEGKPAVSTVRDALKRRKEAEK